MDPPSFRFCRYRSRVAGLIVLAAVGDLPVSVTAIVSLRGAEPEHQLLFRPAVDAAGSPDEPKDGDHEAGASEHDTNHPLDEAGFEAGQLDAQLREVGFRRRAGRVVLNGLTERGRDGVRLFRRQVRIGQAAGDRVSVEHRQDFSVAQSRNRSGCKQRKHAAAGIRPHRMSPVVGTSEESSRSAAGPTASSSSRWPFRRFGLGLTSVGDVFMLIT